MLHERRHIQLRARHLLLFWLVGFLSSMVIQSVFQWWFAEVTIWGRNVGWQTEIAIWNAGVALIIVGLLRQSAEVQAAAIPGLVLLSLAFGSNHLLAGLSAPGEIGHWMGAGANYLGIVLAAYYYARSRNA